MTAIYCPDAARIAKKIRDIEERHAKPQEARYSLITFTSTHSIPSGEFVALTRKEAHRVHVDAWHRRPSSHAVVLLAPDGKRYSYEASVREVAHG